MYWIFHAATQFLSVVHPSCINYLWGLKNYSEKSVVQNRRHLLRFHSVECRYILFKYHYSRSLTALSWRNHVMHTALVSCDGWTTGGEACKLLYSYCQSSVSHFSVIATWSLLSVTDHMLLSTGQLLIY